MLIYTCFYFFDNDAIHLLIFVDHAFMQFILLVDHAAPEHFQFDEHLALHQTITSINVCRYLGVKSKHTSISRLLCHFHHTSFVFVSKQN
jgi:hypothetical protein